MAYRRKFKLALNPSELFDVKFDISTLNAIIGFIFKLSSPLVTKKALMRISELFNFINMDMYRDNPHLETRIVFIKDALDAILKHKYVNINMILSYCRTDVRDDIRESIIDNLNDYCDLNVNELRSVVKLVEDRLKHLYVLNSRDRFEEIFDRIDEDDFRTYKEIDEKYYELCSEFINKSRKVATYDNESSISLTDDNFDEKIEKIVNDAKDPSRYIKTGIRSLNSLLGIGYATKRLYMYMGLPAGFKSGILLKSAIDAKKYNKDIKGRTPTKTPTVLLITMENFLEETVERMFNMVGPGSDIRNFSPRQVIKILREDGDLKVSEENKVDIIIKYVPNNQISTADLYSIIEDLNDDNREIIMLVLDYIKRIRPAEKAKDEKEGLKNVTNELKALAIELNISVVTAHQLNREAARNVDSAMQANKADLARFVGRANVGSAWEVMENADCTIIINRERRLSDGVYFLTFKKVKQRYRTDEIMDYFNHPFEENNGMKLIDDIYLPESLSETSLSETFLDASHEDDTRYNAKKRKRIETGNLDDVKDLDFI